MKERYGLAKERIREVITEETVKEPFGDFFRKMAQFLSMTASRKTMKAVMEIRLMQ